MAIWERVLKLMQDTNDHSSSPNLNQVDYRYVEKLEVEAAAGDLYAREILRRIEEQLRTATIQDHEQHRRIRTACAEARIFYRLKGEVGITRVPEGEVKRPDAVIAFAGRDFYVEIKAPDWVGGNQSLDEHMLENLETVKIPLEQASQGGAVFAARYQRVAPWKTNRPKEIIEKLIEKIVQNVKEDQLRAGDSLLVVDLPRWHLPLVTAPRLEVRQQYVNEDGGGEPGSGILWHVAFGTLGMIVHGILGVEGADPGPLEREGILVRFPWLKALCFHSAGEFFGFVRQETYFGDPDLAELLNRFVTLGNDQTDRLHAGWVSTLARW